MRRFLLFSAITLFTLCVCYPTSAAGFVNANLWLSNEHPLVGSTIKISSIIANEDTRAFGGQIRFEIDEQAIAAPISFELAGGDNSQVLSVSWLAIQGQHAIRASLINTYLLGANDQHLTASGNITSNTLNIFVDIDSDQDTVPNQQEIKNGTNPNNSDTDGDTDPDNTDPAPTNPKIFSVPDNDNDKIPDSLDTDFDNDGLYNWEEKTLGTDPQKYDTDGDGVGDKQDAFPLDPNRSTPLPTSLSLNSSFDGTSTISQSVLGEKIYDVTQTPTIATTHYNPAPIFSRNLIFKILPAFIIFLSCVLLLEFKYFKHF